ncbi:hypothetical protein MMC07_001474 [Pseudocyphellaria aurata]|nr:hypothetical protein [Pseudocyphellaria aurata]
MSMPGYHTKEIYSDEISFGRLFLGMGPKKIKVTVPNATLANLKKHAPAALPAPPPPAAANTPPIPIIPPASIVKSTPKPSATTVKSAAAMTSTVDVKATAETPAWTDMQDALLIGLKKLNKTWKEIGALVEGKDTEDLRERYAELMAVKTGEKKTEAVVEQVKASGATGEKTEENQQKSKKFNKKANQQNGKKGEKGKTSDQEDKGEANPGNEKSHKPGKVAVKPDGDGEQHIHQGPAVIYADPEDGFSTRELLFLSDTHQRLEQNKWLQLSSKLFDKTGLRISPELMEQKFKNVSVR